MAAHVEARMAWLLRVLTQPAEESNLTHYQRRLLEEELEELELRATDRSSLQCQYSMSMDL